MNRRAFFSALFVPAILQPRAIDELPCKVCGSSDIRNLELNVSGRMITRDLKATFVRDDLPPEQYCGNCGTKRVKLH